MIFSGWQIPVLQGEVAAGSPLVQFNAILLVMSAWEIVVH